MIVVGLRVIGLIFDLSGKLLEKSRRHENVPLVHDVVCLGLFKRRTVSESVEQRVGVGLFVEPDVFRSDIPMN